MCMPKTHILVWHELVWVLGFGICILGVTIALLLECLGFVIGGLYVAPEVMIDLCCKFGGPSFGVCTLVLS